MTLSDFANHAHEVLAKMTNSRSHTEVGHTTIIELLGALNCFLSVRQVEQKHTFPVNEMRPAVLRAARSLQTAKELIAEAQRDGIISGDRARQLLTELSES